METSYIEYLRSARTLVQNCVNACRTWSAPYNGENPTVESFSDNRHAISASRTAADENVTSNGEKDGIVSSQNDVDVVDVSNAAGTAAAAIVIPSSYDTCTPSSTADDAITQSQVIPFPSASSVANSLSEESVADNAGVSLAVVSADSGNQQEQSCSESAEPVSSASNQDAAQPGIPPGHLSTISTSDDLELFFRQLSHASCKSDSDKTADDILTALDEVLSQLDTPTEDFDSQKTLTPEDPVFSDFTENSQSQTEKDEAAIESGDSTASAAEQTSDGSLLVKAQEGKMPASAAGNDEDEDKDDDDDDDVRGCSKTRPFSLLLFCKYEPPYLPTIGTSTSGCSSL